MRLWTLQWGSEPWEWLNPKLRQWALKNVFGTWSWEPPQNFGHQEWFSEPKMQLWSYRKRHQALQTRLWALQLWLWVCKKWFELELGAVLTLAGCSVPLPHPLLIHSGSLVFPLLAFTVRGASFEEQSDGHHSVVPSGGCWLLLSFVVRHILLFCDWRLRCGENLSRFWLWGSFFFPPPFLGKSHYVLKHFASVSLFLVSRAFHCIQLILCASKAIVGGKAEAALRKKTTCFFFFITVAFFPFHFFLIYFYLLFFLCLTLI